MDIAREHRTFARLTRATFDRLLPDVATWLSPDELQSVVAGYQSQGGYEQAAQDGDLPPPVRDALLARISEAHHRALRTLEVRAFEGRASAELRAAELGVSRQEGGRRG